MPENVRLRIRGDNSTVRARPISMIPTACERILSDSEIISIAQRWFKDKELGLQGSHNQDTSDEYQKQHTGIGYLGISIPS